MSPGTIGRVTGLASKPVPLPAVGPPGLADGRADEAGAILVDCMTRDLLQIYREAEDMGVARLTAAKVVDRSEKD
jgi:hypothetical protein